MKTDINPLASVLSTTSTK